jgi:osmotically inducible protein OsmC
MVTATNTIVRTSEAVWEGSVQQGRGTMKVGRVYDGPYSFASRFADGGGTNPEELLAAAHAGCYSMALSNILTQAGHPPQSIHTVARVHLGKTEGGFEIPRIDLETEASVPGIDEEEFRRHAETAKENCPVSKLFSGAEISLDASLSE